MSKDKKKKPASGGSPAPADPTPVSLPAVLAEDGELQLRLDAAEREVEGNESQEDFVGSLRAALKRLRSKCIAKLAAERPKPDKRDRACAKVLRERPATEEPEEMFLRLIALMKLAGEPSEGLWRAGLEFYQRNPPLVQHVLGPVLPRPLRDEAARLCYVTNAHVSALDDFAVFLDRLGNRRKNPLPGLETGLRSFDERTGGLYDLTVLAGDTSSGKTSLAMQLVVDAVRRSGTVGGVHIDFEMGKDAINGRILSREAGLSQRRMAAPDRTEVEEKAITDACRRLKKEVLPRYWIESWEPQDVRGQIDFRWFQRLLLEQRGLMRVETLVVLVDSLQRMPVGDEVVERDEDGNPTRRHRPSELDAMRIRMELLLQVQRWSREVAPPAGFPILVTSRTRKPTGGRLDKADVLGGVDAVFDPHAVLLLEPHGAQATDEVTPSILNVAKAREFGLCGDIRLDFHHTVSTFREPGPPPAPAVAAKQQATARFGGKSNTGRGRR